MRFAVRLLTEILPAAHRREPSDLWAAFVLPDTSSEETTVGKKMGGKAKLKVVGEAMSSLGHKGKGKGKKGGGFKAASYKK